MPPLCLKIYKHMAHNSRQRDLVGGSSADWSLLGNSATVEGTNFIGTTDNVSLSFRANNIRYAKLFTDGQLMLSDVSTSFANSISGGFLLALQSEFGSPLSANILQRTHGTGNQGIHFFEKANGTITAPTNISLGQEAGRLTWRGYAAGAFRPMANIRVLTDSTAGNTISATSMPSEIRFEVTPNSGIVSVPRMTLKSNGNLGLGTVVPHSTLHNTGSQAFNPTIVTASLSVVNESYLICNNGATNITITLPNPSTMVGRLISISRYANSTGTITVTNLGTASIQAQLGTIGATTTIAAFGANNFWIVKFMAVTVGATSSWVRV